MFGLSFVLSRCSFFSERPLHRLFPTLGGNEPKKKKKERLNQSIPRPNWAIYGSVFSQTGLLKSLSEPSLPLEHSVRECGNNNNALSQSWLATTLSVPSLKCWARRSAPESRQTPTARPKTHSQYAHNEKVS